VDESDATRTSVAWGRYVPEAALRSCAWAGRAGTWHGMEITAETVLERVRAAGGHLLLEDLDDEERAAWRRASRIVQLRLLRVGHERLRRNSGPGRLDLRLTRTDREESEAAHGYERWSPPPPVVPRTAEFVGRTVPVPSRVSKPHPLLAQLESALDWPQQSKQDRWGGYPPPSPQRPLQRMRRIWPGRPQPTLAGSSGSVTGSPPMPVGGLVRCAARRRLGPGRATGSAPAVAVRSPVGNAGWDAYPGVVRSSGRRCCARGAADAIRPVRDHPA
jgi:hypothetical protein